MASETERRDCRTCDRFETCDAVCEICHGKGLASSTDCHDPCSNCGGTGYIEPCPKDEEAENA